jgi:UDP-glucose 6-dehydrogenase
MPSESAAIDVCKMLLEEGANINVYDPKVSVCLLVVTVLLDVPAGATDD